MCYKYKKIGESKSNTQESEWYSKKFKVYNGINKHL